MDWIVPRLLLAWLALGAGAALGHWAGAVLQWPVAGLLAGAAIGVGLAILIDALRGHRLLEWLRGDQAQAGPRVRGLWGELAYRVERALRLREKELTAQRQHLTQFLAAIEASPNGVLLLDGDDHIEWCNSVAAAHFGLDPQRDRGQPVTNLVRAPGFVGHLQGGHFETPVSFDLPGRSGTVSVLVRPYGKASKLVLSQDVTERLRSDAMRRDFVANVSHEIRSPLTVLAGFVETLASLPLTEAERARVLLLMKQQTDRMQSLVADLLTLAQLEGSPRPPADRWVPVDGLLQRVRADALALSAQRHQVLFDEAAGASLAGSESELHSALGNLVSNAVRYTPEGGRIEVRWVERADGSALFEVADTGPGIAKEHLPRLAERFYRVDGSRSRETGGTGLGLAIAKHAVQRHGGELEIDSEPGRGSQFRLVFPPARVRHGDAMQSPGDLALHGLRR